MLAEEAAPFLCRLRGYAPREAREGVHGRERGAKVEGEAVRLLPGTLRPIVRRCHAISHSIGIWGTDLALAWWQRTVPETPGRAGWLFRPRDLVD